MPDFINTIDALGDDAVMDSLIERTITEFKDDQLTFIGSRAFSGCSMLEYVDLPNITTLSDYAFCECTNLSQLSLPKVTTIGGNIISLTQISEFCLPLITKLPQNSVRNCPALTLLDLPSCTQIADSSLAEDPKLTTLILRSETLCITGRNMFYMTKNPISLGTGYIYVPRALIEDYKVAENWSTYASQFRAIEDYTVDGTTTGELDESKI